MGSKNYRTDAFTLVELLIAFSIVAILATIAVSQLRSQILKGNDAIRKADLNRIRVAAEEYEKDNNCYPPAALMSCNPGDGLVPYTKKIPCDPTTKASYAYDIPAGSCVTWFRLYATLEYSMDPAITPNIGPGGAYNFVLKSSNAP